MNQEESRDEAGAESDSDEFNLRDQEEHYRDQEHYAHSPESPASSPEDSVESLAEEGEGEHYDHEEGGPQPPQLPQPEDEVPQDPRLRARLRAAEGREGREGREGGHRVVREGEPGTDAHTLFGRSMVDDYSDASTESGSKMDVEEEGQGGRVFRSNTTPEYSNSNSYARETMWL